MNTCLHIPPTYAVGTHNFNYLRQLVLILGLAMFLTLTGCNESEDATGSEEKTSELTIGLTDAPGGFSTYTVDVLSLQLLTASGAVVETLPVNTRIDFAQYTDLTEFLTAATVPSAKYVKGIMTLDYSNAEIWVTSSSNQQAVKVETFVDPDGNPITTLDVSVHLQNRNSLTIVPGVPAYLTLDFNLAASNNLQTDELNQPFLVVEPVLIAELNPERPKVHRVRGPLLSVDPDDSIFQLAIHPFNHRMANNDRRFGKLNVLVNENTIYDIDNQRYQGEIGLTALANKPQFTATVALGDYNVNLRRYLAHHVFAGSSVPGGTLDVVSGNVTKREGTTLTVQGATLIRQDGSVIFNDSVVVEVSTDTKVRKLMAMDEQDIDAISVGQKVSVFGTLLESDSLSPLTLDATKEDDHVNMGMTVLRGFSIDASGPITAKLQSIDFRSVNLFDFTGTGIDEANNADPMNYEIDSSTLDTSFISPGSPIAVGGFVNPFGQAPLDFSATTVVDLSEVPGVMVVNWDPSAEFAFASLSNESIILDLTGTGVFHHIGRAGVNVDLTALDTPPSILPASDGMGTYIIVDSRSAKLFTEFSLFISDLQTQMNAGSRVKVITAQGDYDDLSATIMSERIKVKLD